MNKKFQVFISSTFDDLKLERQAAVEAILKCHHIPAGMELFSAGNESQLEVIKRWIDESDIYILILGGRYGTIEKKTGLSYTEIEFDYAVENGKPMFSVVLSEESIEEKVKKHGSEMIERNEPRKLELFRKKVLSRMCNIANDCKDIRLGIMQSIPDLVWQNDLIGWVRGDAISKPAKTIEKTSSSKNEMKFLLTKATPNFELPISLTDIRNIIFDFNNPVDRSTACFIGIFNPHENSFYQLDSSGGIRYANGNKQLIYRMSDPVFNILSQYANINDGLYSYEIHIGRSHPDTLIKDESGNTLPQTIIPIFIK
ncbi:DUF4062 domain-containing protein [Oxalobacteraceae bacterium OTU3CAMAD1]|nr:DUF4062 domain-containing protein [Oxalobacteraceae bacterium OTU3CAMAD1]